MGFPVYAAVSTLHTSSLVRVSRAASVWDRRAVLHTSVGLPSVELLPGPGRAQSRRLPLPLQPCFLPRTVAVRPRLAVLCRAAFP